MEMKIKIPSVLRDIMVYSLSGHEKNITPYISRSMWLFLTTYLHDYYSVLNRVLVAHSSYRDGVTKKIVEEQYDDYCFGEIDADTLDSLYREMYNSLSLELGDTPEVDKIYNSVSTIVETIFDPEYKRSEIIESLEDDAEVLSETGAVMLDVELLVSGIFKRNGRYDKPVDLYTYQIDDFTPVSLFNTKTLKSTDDILDHWRAFISNVPEDGCWFMVEDMEIFYSENCAIPQIPKPGVDYELYVVS